VRESLKDTTPTVPQQLPPDPLASAVARSVSDLRHSAGLSERAAARKLGTSQTQLRRMEDPRYLPSLRSLARLATVYGYELKVDFAQKGAAVTADRGSRGAGTFSVVQIAIVTGTTGSGKSTTLAAMIDKINRERKGHIITVEDPIEFIHKHQGCIINQREIGSDTKSFANALKYALREDPDVILIGEMRDLETIAAALTIAETGHLAFATLHTNSAAEAINRIIDVFPSHQQSQVRAQLAFVLEGIVTQTLLPKAQGKGRVMAAEILVVTPAIRALIRDDKVHQIYSSMQSGKKFGMQTLNDALYALYMNREVAADECLRVSGDPVEFQRMIGQLDPTDDSNGTKQAGGKPTATRGPVSGSPAKR